MKHQRSQSFRYLENRPRDNTGDNIEGYKPTLNVQPRLVIFDHLMSSENIPSNDSAVTASGWKTRATLLLVGQAFSLLGSNIVQYAIWWHIVLDQNTGLSMLMTTLFGVLPQGIVSLFGGTWADRHNKRMLIVLPDIIIACVSAGLACSMAFGWAPLALIFIVLLIRSAGAGVQTPAVQSFIPQIVPPNKLLRVNSINGVIQSANMIACPALAAAIINIMPLWSILLIDVTTALIGVGFMLLIKIPIIRSAQVSTNIATVEAAGTSSHATTPESGLQHVINDFRIGLHYAAKHRRIRNILMSDALVCLIAVAPLNLTMLLMTRDFANASLNLFGLISLSEPSEKLAANELSWSIGMLIGGAVLSALGPRLIRDSMRAISNGIILTALCTFAMGLAPTILIYLVISFASGLFTPLVTAAARTLIQEECDEAYIGRVFGLDITLTTFAMPIGMAVFGPLADIIPVTWVFMIGGALTLPVGLWLLTTTHRAPSYE